MIPRKAGGTGGGTVKVGGASKGAATHGSALVMTNTQQAEFFLRKFNRYSDVDRPKVRTHTHDMMH